MSNDLISREALKIIIEQNQLVNAKLSVHDVLKIIDNAPAVEALITDEEIKDFAKENFDLGYGMAKVKFSPKQGEWKHIVEEDNDVECPFCGFQEDGIYYNFCPGCGADMQKKHHCSLWDETNQQCSICNHPCPDDYTCEDFN